MSNEKEYVYRRVKGDAQHLVQLLQQAEYLEHLKYHNIIKEDLIREDYEEVMLRDVKSALSRIYIELELHKVEGRLDVIYNKDFTTEDE